MIGKTLAHYEITSRLDKGGMGGGLPGKEPINWQVHKRVFGMIPISLIWKLA